MLRMGRAPIWQAMPLSRLGSARLERVKNVPGVLAIDSNPEAARVSAGALGSGHALVGACAARKAPRLRALGRQVFCAGTWAKTLRGRRADGG
jgi:hypothetical protein